MWMECSPGGRFLISMVILTPLGAGVRVAVPTLWPCAFLMSTVTGFAAAARARQSCTKTRPAADKNSAAQTRDLMVVLLTANCDLEFGFSWKASHLNLAQGHRGCNKLSSNR